MAAMADADAEIAKPDPNEPDIAKITITKYTVKQDYAGSSFAVYEISMESNKYGRWQVHRRYNDFTKLSQDLRSEGFSDLPQLPSKTVVSNLSSKFLEARRQSLELFLGGLLDLPGCSSSNAFMQFIGAELLFDKKTERIESFPYAYRSGRPMNSPHNRKKRGEGECSKCLIL